MTKKKRLLCNLLLLAAFAVYVFIACPNLNPLYSDGAFTWCLLITVIAAVNLLWKAAAFAVEMGERGLPRVSFVGKGKKTRIGLGILLVCWIGFALVTIVSTVWFHYTAYRDQLGTPEISEFTDTVQPISQDQLPIVDKNLAAELADKKLGENPGLGSQVQLGTPVIQQVNGKLVWAVPLEHSGVFKWLKNMSGTTGYIVVSATDVNDVRLVEDHRIKYQAGAYLLDDLERHVRLTGGGLFRGITDYSFELDDGDVPHWVVTTYHNKWLFSLPEADGVIIVNAETGKSDFYPIGEVPDWVDRVQPESFVMQQIANRGEYIHGFLNFSNQDKFRTSEGHIIVYNEGNCYLFTGLTSVGSDESAIGFMMVDMVTKETKMYQMGGATETAAMSSAQGKVQQYGYQAALPMIINLDGSPTYFMTLKDRAGLIKQYAFVSVISYANVGTGETIPAALADYRRVMRESNTGNVETNAGLETVAGTVKRISGEASGGGITYRMILEEEPKTIFSAVNDLSMELCLTQPGDRVKIEYLPEESGLCAATSFDNMEFTQGVQ